MGKDDRPGLGSRSPFSVRSDLGRGDFIRAYAAIDSEASEPLAALFGLSPEKTRRATKPDLPEPDSSIEHRAQPENKRPLQDVPKRAHRPVRFLIAQSMEFFESVQSTSNQELLSTRGAQFRFDQTVHPVPKEASLAAWSRLEPVLRSALCEGQLGHRLDLEALVDRIGRGRTLEQLPKVSRMRWPLRLSVWSDRSPRLHSIRNDQDEVVAQLVRRLGSDSITHRSFDADRVQDISFETNESVLALTDLGFYGDARTRQRWCQRGAQIARNGSRPVALCPVGTASLRNFEAPPWRLVPWERSVDGVAAFGTVQQRAEYLVGLLCFLPRIERGLLRAVRMLLPRDRFGIEVEVAAWQHPFVMGRHPKALVVDADVAQQWKRAHFDTADRKLKADVIRLVRKWMLGVLSEEFWYESVFVLWDEIPDDLKEEDHRKASSFAWWLGHAVLPEAIDLEVSKDMARGWYGRFQKRAPSALFESDSPVVDEHGERPLAYVRAQLELPNPSLVGIVQKGDRLLVARKEDGFGASGLIASLPAQKPSVDFQFGRWGQLQSLSWAHGLAVDKAMPINLKPPVEFGGWATEEGEDEWGLWACVGVGKISFRMRWVEPGKFTMGSPSDEQGRSEREGPQHEVELTEGYWLCEVPCTQALWEAVMGDNPSSFRSAERPVENVSWGDCQSFLQKLNERVPGLEACLPTEAQWEYACRAGTTTSTYAGELEILGENNGPLLDSIAWYGGNSGVEFDLEKGEDSSYWKEKQYEHTKAGTRIVGQKAPNSFGLYDMLGNVWEWCADGRRDYEEGSVTDPVGPQNEGARRVVRGGAWRYFAQNVRAAFRHDYLRDYRVYDLGFRFSRGQKEKKTSQSVKRAAGKARERAEPRNEAAAKPAGSAPNLTLITDRAKAEIHVIDKPIWASVMGRDRFGLWAEVRLDNSIWHPTHRRPTGAAFRMRHIPPGSFQMGALPDEGKGNYPEVPRHEVRLTKGYWLCEVPCTQALWVAVMGKNPSRFKDQPEHPVESVSWNDCQSFLQKLNERVPALRAELPTEAQWEYACRAGSQEARYGELEQVAWYLGNSDEQTHPVGQKDPNAWGLYDTLGNVWERCADGMRDYEEGSVTDPVGPQDEGAGRVLRGGAWHILAQHVRAAYRFDDHRDNRGDDLGFRFSRGQ